MNRKLIIAIWFFLPAISSLGQNLQLIDSIKTLLRNAKGNAKFDLMNDLAWEHRFAAPDSTILIGNQAYFLGKKLSLTKGLARPLNIIGVAYNYK